MKDVDLIRSEAIAAFSNIAAAAQLALHLDASTLCSMAWVNLVLGRCACLDAMCEGRSPLAAGSWRRWAQFSGVGSGGWRGLLALARRFGVGGLLPEDQKM